MKISLCVEMHDGNDAFEVEVDLPIVPPIGSTIEMYDPGADSVLGYAQTDHFPVVEDIILSTYRPEYIRVFLRFDGYDRKAIRRTMLAVEEGVTP